MMKSVSELKARFNSSGGTAPPSPGTAFGSGAAEVHRQPTAAPTTATAAAPSQHSMTMSAHLPAVLTGPRPFGSVSSGPKPAAGVGGGGANNAAGGSGSKTAATATRLSTAGAFGVVLKSTGSSRRDLELDVNGNGDADGSSSHPTFSVSSSSPPADADDSASSSSADAPPSADKAAAPESDKVDAMPSRVTSGIGRLPSPGGKSPQPLSAKPTVPSAATSGFASVKPALAVRPVGLRVPGASAAGASGTSAALSPGSTVRVGAVSPSSAVSPTSSESPGGLAREKHESPPVLPSQKSPSKPAVPPSHPTAPDNDEPPAAVPEDSGAGRLEAIKRRLRPVTATVDDTARASGPSSKTAVTADAAVSSRLPAKHGAALQAVVTDASGAKFRKVQFVATQETAAPAKPNSLTDCVLPSVTWAAADSTSTPVSPTAAPGRAVSLIAPTTEEEEEYDEGSSSGFIAASPGGSASVQQPAAPRLPPRLSGAAAVSSPSVSSSDIATSDVYDEGVSGAAAFEDDEHFEEYDDVSAIPPLPERNAALRAKVDSADAVKLRKEEEEKRQKEEERKQKEEEKRQKEEEKRQKAKEKEEKKERERREKEAQKKEAELQKLLASFKVSATAQPVCEATVTADNLKPGKNELSVRTGDRLLILAKDTKGKWLAKNGSNGSIGLVASSMISELDSRNDDEEQYADADDVYSELD